MLRGEYTITAGGKERHFKLCTLSDSLFCQYENIKLSEYRERILNPTGFTQLHLIYSQAVAYARIQKTTIDFTIEDVSVWVDEIGERAFSAELEKIAKAQIEKNGQALTAGQVGSGTNA